MPHDSRQTAFRAPPVGACSGGDDRSTTRKILATTLVAAHCAVWGAALFVASWMLFYGMLFTLVAFTPLLWLTRPCARTRGHRVALAAVAAAAALLLAAPPEYAATTNSLHCRTIGFMGRRFPTDCSPKDVQEGRQVALRGGPLFSATERLGVHLGSLLLVAGGHAFALGQVADEHLWLMTGDDAFEGEFDGGAQGAPAARRRRQCRASAGGAKATLARSRSEDDDFFLQSGAARAAVAAALARLPSRAGTRVWTRPVHWARGGSYLHALMHDSIRTALALEVQDSRVLLTRLDGGLVELRWEGTIHYPGTDISLINVAVPTVVGWRRLRLSEAVFCGMQIDGAMAPYGLTYRTQVAADDPRLSRSGRVRSAPGVFHGFIGWVLRRVFAVYPLSG